MGVVSACAFSFMSKYLHQSCGPKPMTRVDINDNNQIFQQKLQTRITSFENTRMDISAFKNQESEVNEKLQVSQQDLYENMDIIQKHYQAINNSMKNIYEKEREAFMARSKFQEFVVWRQKLNVPGITPFS
jgi:hypothetical protein